MTDMQIICFIAIIGSLIIGMAHKDRKTIIGSLVVLAVCVFLMWASGTVF